ncbi:MAG: LURP-one-related family protein [Clostridia bacterium]|nr:LURP-one-related family protein [Clostridia bacterium]
MKYYIKQKVFSWGDKFNIFTGDGRTVYTVKGEVFSWGKKLHVYDENGDEAAFIHQKTMSLHPKYIISIDGEDVAAVRKEFTFLKPKYTIDGLGWNVSGKAWCHDYKIDNGYSTVAVISKQWFTWGDTYEIEILSEENEIEALCVVLIIDAVLDSQQAAENG